MTTLMWILKFGRLFSEFPQRQAPVCSQAPKVHDWFRLAPDRYIGEFVTNFEDFRDRQGWIISLIILETLAHLYWKDWKGMTEASQTPTS